MVDSQIFLPGDDQLEPDIFITPVPLTLATPFCFQQFDQLRCLAILTNPSTSAAENIGVDMYLIGTEGQVLEKITVPLLTNSLYPNESLPAIGTFLINEPYNSVQAVLSSATFSTNTIYERNSPDVNVSAATRWNGKSAEIKGSINPDFEGSVWVVALGWNEKGELTAAQKWEWNEGESSLNRNLDFGLVAFSGPIFRVNLIIETWQ